MSNEVSIQPAQPIELTLVQTDPVLAGLVQAALDGLVTVNAQLSQTVSQAQFNNLAAQVNDMAAQISQMAAQIAALETAGS